MGEHMSHISPAIHGNAACEHDPEENLQDQVWSRALLEVGKVDAWRRKDDRYLPCTDFDDLGFEKPTERYILEVESIEVEAEEAK